MKFAPHRLSALTEALDAADKHEEREHEAEIYRLKGELLLKQDQSNAREPEKSFQRAIEIARKQSAKSWELRATSSLARLLVVSISPAFRVKVGTTALEHYGLVAADHSAGHVGLVLRQRGPAVQPESTFTGRVNPSLSEICSVPANGSRASSRRSG